MRWKHGIWLGLATCAILAAAGAIALSRWQTASERQLQASWQQRIASASEDQAAEFVRSLRRHDAPAIDTLAAALADRRPTVARSAQEAISNLVYDWKTLPARQSVPRLIKLTEKVAERYEHLSPPRQQFARQLAQVILAWPLEDADFPADELVVQCERILTAPAPANVDADEQPLPPVAAPRVATRPSPAVPPPPSQPEQQHPAPVLTTPELAPVEEQTGPASPVESPPADPRPTEPRQFIRPRVPMIPPPDEP